MFVITIDHQVHMHACALENMHACCMCMLHVAMQMFPSNERPKLLIYADAHEHDMHMHMQHVHAHAHAHVHVHVYGLMRADCTCTACTRARLPGGAVHRVCTACTGARLPGRSACGRPAALGGWCALH